MTEQRVAQLYDALHAFETRRRGGRAYPVHKRLAAERFGAEDIYDWIAERIEPRAVREVLDAGCGVGYGAIRLATKLECSVTGVTLSERELESARVTARESGLGARVQFRRASFDELPSGAYDLVVAVESLKHSRDVAASARSMLASLRPGGQLVIVDDCYDGRRRAAVERELTSDWELARLYTEHDFRAALGAAARCRVVDLSDNVKRNGKVGIALRSLGLALLRPFVGASSGDALRAFRGGLRLEALYADGAMAYKAFFCRKGHG
jgi:SAM-dependent methyltransferase